MSKKIDDSGLRAALQAQIAKMKLGPTFAELQAANESDCCDECGDEYTDSGPSAQSLAQPGTCVYCYENGDDEEAAEEQRQAEAVDRAYDNAKDEVP